MAPEQPGRAPRASASSQATAGAARAFASGSADSRLPGDPVRIGSGISDAFFYDSGPIVSSTLAAGAPVTLSGSLVISGSFVGSGANGNGQFYLFKNGFTRLQRSPSLVPTQGLVVENFTFNDFVVGDTVGFFLGITASANGSNALESNRSAVADMTSTGRLFLSVDTPGAQFNSASGYIYAIPVPSTALLCALGLGVIVFRVSAIRQRATRA